MVGGRTVGAVWGVAARTCSILLATKFFSFSCLIDFNDMSTNLGLFYSERSGNHFHCMFILTFFRVVVS